MRQRENDESILFSKHFHQVYTHLGVFGAMYVRAGYEGIDPQAFIRETRICNADTPAILSRLEEYRLIRSENGKLHLNRWLFVNMSVWDLLIMVEPWLKEERVPAMHEEFEKLKKFSQDTNLSASYLENPA